VNAQRRRGGNHFVLNLQRRAGNGLGKKKLAKLSTNQENIAPSELGTKNSAGLGTQGAGQERRGDCHGVARQDHSAEWLPVRTCAATKKTRGHISRSCSTQNPKPKTHCEHNTPAGGFRIFVMSHTSKVPSTDEDTREKLSSLKQTLLMSWQDRGRTSSRNTWG
jgi:hypothetical protein